MSFPALWSAAVLPRRPLILPPRHFVYPAQVEEVERGALEVMVRPRDAEPFLGTFALGFLGGLSGLWSSPDPHTLCAVSGGYAYLVNTAEPTAWEQVSYRPATGVMAALEAGLLLFVGHRSVAAYNARGFLWESPVLSSEGIDDLRIAKHRLLGAGWELMSDRSVPFEVDLETGKLVSGGV